jgi:hypothetical protein
VRRISAGPLSTWTPSSRAGEPAGPHQLETIFRLKPSIGQKNWTPDQSLGESARWLRGVQNVDAQLAGHVGAIHVMDREGDQMTVLSALSDANQPLVIRSLQDRRLAGDKQTKLRDAALAAKPTGWSCLRC